MQANFKFKKLQFFTFRSRMIVKTISTLSKHVLLSIIMRLDSRLDSKSLNNRAVLKRSKNFRQSAVRRPTMPFAVRLPSNRRTVRP